METATHDGHQANGHIAIDTPENPLHNLTAEEIEQIGREFETCPRMSIPHAAQRT